MNVSEQLQWRYATKDFDPKKKLSDAQIEQLLEVLHMSPSAGNTQPWHFIVSQSEASRERIAHAAKGRFDTMYSRTKDASIAIVACAKTTIDDAYLSELLALEEKTGRYSDDEQKKELDRARRNSIDIHTNRLKDLPCWAEHQVYLSVGMLVMAAAEMKIDVLVYESIDWSKINDEFSFSEKGLKPILIILAGFRSDDDHNTPPERPKCRWPKSSVFTKLD